MSTKLDTLMTAVRTAAAAYKQAAGGLWTAIVAAKRGGAERKALADVLKAEGIPDGTARRYLGAAFTAADGKLATLREAEESIGRVASGGAKGGKQKRGNKAANAAAPSAATAWRFDPGIGEAISKAATTPTGVQVGAPALAAALRQVSATAIVLAEPGDLLADGVLDRIETMAAKLSAVDVAAIAERFARAAEAAAKREAAEAEAAKAAEAARVAAEAAEAAAVKAAARRPRVTKAEREAMKRTDVAKAAEAEAEQRGIVDADSVARIAEAIGARVKAKRGQRAAAKAAA